MTQPLPARLTEAADTAISQLERLLRPRGIQKGYEPPCEGHDVWVCRGKCADE